MLLAKVGQAVIAQWKTEDGRHQSLAPLCSFWRVCLFANVVS